MARRFCSARGAVLAVFAILGAAGEAARAQEYRIEEVSSILDVSPAALKPNTIAFSDYRNNELADAKSGLIKFVDWGKAKPLQKQLLSLYPGYEEPTLTVTVAGAAKPVKRRLHVYVAEARFELPRAPQAVSLERYARLGVAFLDRMDPAIKHQLIRADDVTPNKEVKLANRHPARRWCEGAATVICIKSRYRFEGKLPTAILLLNKLREGGKQIADFIEFESELRIVPAAEIDQAGLAQLTGIATPVADALEWSIVHVNQVMQFGKFLAVLQPKPADASHTIVTVFVTLAVESDLFEKRKEYESVPVLRNMVPAQVLSGNSSFNSGNSISAGLPVYARNRIKAMAAILSRE